MGANPKQNWDKIRNEYVTTNIGQRPLATKYNVSYATIRARAKKEEWSKQREKYRGKLKQKVEKKTEELAEEAAAVIVDRNLIHIEIWDALLDRAKKLIENNKSARVVGFAVKDVDLGTDDLEKLSRALDKAQKGHRLALGLDKEDAVKQEDRPTVVDDIQ